MRKIFPICLAVIFSGVLTGCYSRKGATIPFIVTSYNYSYLNSLEGGKLGEPLSEVTIKDEAAAIKLYGSVEAAETFESYFPDDIKGGKKLDRWWSMPFKTLRSDKNIIKTIRHGLRRTTKDKTKILRWVGKRYGAPKNFLNKYSLKGYTLMYYASFSPEKDVRNAAVRYGIARHRGGGAGDIYKRLLQLAMKGENVDDTSFMLRMNHQAGRDLMMKYLQPYLDSPDPKVRRQAAFLKEKFNK